MREKIDWSLCPMVEANPRVQGGAPVLRGMRTPVSAIVDNFVYGLSVAEISEQFEIPAIALHILFDKNVPVGMRRFLAGHEVRTVVEMKWPDQLENGELLKAAGTTGFDVLVISDQNIPYPENLTGRTLPLVVLGSNIWPIVLTHAEAIAAATDAATPGSYALIEMPIAPRPRA